MRIFCAVRHSVDPHHYYGGLWSSNFYPALRELGHEIIESETDLLPTSRFMQVTSDFTVEEKEERARTTEQILKEIRAAHAKAPIDLFLSYFYNAHFDPAGFDELRRLSIPSVNFYCNSIYQFDLVRDIAANADYAWHSERDARPLYLQVSASPVWVQMGADPAVYHPVDCVRQPNASFIGQRYADRDRWAAALIRADVPIVIYGPGWNAGITVSSNLAAETSYLGRRNSPAGSTNALIDVILQNLREEGLLCGALRTWRQFQYRRESRQLSPLFRSVARGAIPFDQQRTVFSSSEVVLNFSNVWADGRPGSKLVPHVRLRDFEAPMCRACYLTGYTDEIGEFYELGTEIDCYRTPAELLDKTKFYLKHVGAAERMRERGYKRALNSHTWRHRFEELFLKLGLRNPRVSETCG